MNFCCELLLNIDVFISLNSTCCYSNSAVCETNICISITMQASA